MILVITPDGKNAYLLSLFFSFRCHDSHTSEHGLVVFIHGDDVKSLGVSRVEDPRGVDGFPRGQLVDPDTALVGGSLPLR